MSIYPEALDSDLELPRVEPEVSEISGDYINSVRDAVIAIQKTIGVQPQGNKSSLVDRINISIDANGYIKKSALENIGLVTLPVVDRHIGQAAGIQESKLALDYTTRSLKTMIDSMRVDVNGIATGLASITNTVNMHLLGQAYFHDGYQIRINLGDQIGIAGLDATTVGDAVNEVSSYLFGGNELIIPHLELSLTGDIKHIAENISVDATSFVLINRDSKNVQEALESLDSGYLAAGITHVDQFHSNGIFKNINSSGAFNSRYKLFDSLGISYSAETSVVKFNDIVSLSAYGVSAGDIISIATTPNDTIIDAGIYQIRAVGPLADADTLGALPVLAENEVAIFHTFSETRPSAAAIPASVYEPASVSSDQCPLACIVRNSETIVDTVSIMNPQAARVMSIGFNGPVLNVDGYSIGITAGVGPGQYRTVVVPNLNKYRLAVSQATPVDSGSVAERINAYLADPDIGAHFPVTAYRIGNELAIAHNWSGADYTLEIADGYSGNYALGLDAYGANILGQKIIGNEAASFTVNGSVLSSIETLFDGYCDIAASSSVLVLQNNTGGDFFSPKKHGITAGSVLHVIGHPILNANGSYTIMDTADTFVSLFEAIPAYNGAPTRFYVKIFASDVPCTVVDTVETEKGLLQIYIDENGSTQLHQKLIYGSSLGAGVEITNASSSFPAGTYSVIAGVNGDYLDFYLMEGALLSEISSVHKTFKGSFRLYHPNGLAYLIVQLIPGAVIPGAMDTIKVSSSLNDDEAMLLCTAHFNGELNITNVVDERLFGSLGLAQIREDFVETFSQRPVSELHADGVVRGFDLLDMPYFDFVTHMPSLPLRGGVAYINGIRVAVNSQKVIVPAYNSSGVLIANSNKVIGINGFGSIQILTDDLGELLVDGYNADAAFGKILPLYYVTIIDGGIADVIDIRRYINNIDDKIEIIVDPTNNIVGNFRTLDGALLYASKYPSREKLVIKIINSVYSTRALVIPEGVSIIGSTSYGGNNKHQIINSAVVSTNFIQLSGSNRLENVEIIANDPAINSSLVYVAGPNVNIEKCLFRFKQTIGSYSGAVAITIGPNATENVRVVDNLIYNVYSGIVSDFGVENLIIRNNKISDVQGTGGFSYGICVGNSNREIQNIIISDNQIFVPSVLSGTDLRGLAINIGPDDIHVLRITNNNIIHSAQNTMTHGIVIKPTSDGIIQQLFIIDNLINGIKLDDNNVYGMYISSVDNAVIRGNTIQNVGVYDTGRDAISVIKLAPPFGFVEIVDNILKDCSAIKGIDITTQTAVSQINIAGNTLINLGASAEYIRGSSAHSTIENNNLGGPGLTGIYWAGANSKISGNNLGNPNNAAYAFSKIAIYVPTADIDVTDNVINGMLFGYGSMGISNYNHNNGSTPAPNRDRAKIINNTINGSMMNLLLDVCGSQHIINSNRLFNEAIFAGQPTSCMRLNAAANSLVMGNFMNGQIDYGIYSDSSAATSLTIVNNTVGNGTLSASYADTSINIASIVLNGATTHCFVMGNRFPNGSGGTNIIGTTPYYGSYNNNVIGTNVGLQDVISIHASAGASACDSTGSGNQYYHWAIKDLNDYWEVNSTSVSDPRRLYFPISGIPNGAKLNAVRVQGKLQGTAKGTLTGQICKRSVKSGSPLTNTAVSFPVKDMSTASDEFSNTTTIGKIAIGTAEVINYAESNYYVQITHSGANPVSPTEIRIYGITLEFTY